MYPFCSHQINPSLPEQTEHGKGWPCRIWEMHMVHFAARATLFAVVALTSTSALAADCGTDADEVNAKCYPTLQAAADAALAADLPLLLPRGTYRITAPLVIDYSRHADTGFELISRGATIDGTAVG